MIVSNVNWPKVLYRVAFPDHFVCMVEGDDDDVVAVPLADRVIPSLDIVLPLSIRLLQILVYLTTVSFDSIWTLLFGSLLILLLVFFFFAIKMKENNKIQVASQKFDYRFYKYFFQF